ncbi:MAG: TonB-dependent receptor, partial [Acidobacteria bacterium]|nr:TonB-dependent receptor [Acidobacteriota bacterium]
GGALPTNVILNGQVQYRRNRADRLDVFPQLDGVTRGTTLAVPIRLDVAKGPLLHGLNVSVTRTTSVTANRFAFSQDVAGEAGIEGAAEDPFTWGVPNLSFASVSGVSDTVPSRRVDRRLQVSYTVSRPSTRHTLRFGTDFRQDAASSQTDANARGTFVFTGLYAGGGVPTAGRTGLDLADFLLGLPQQASVQYGPGLVELRSRSFAAFAQDDWRPGGPVTINLGVRYELVHPFTEADGRMVNLDANPGFTAVAPVLAGGEGAFSGTYPDALVRTDRNNVAPRVGVAWRVNPRTVVRSGYGVSFNNGSYATIARQLVAQPPFAVTATSLGTAGAPLALTSALTAVTPQTTTNNYGIAVDYQLGVIQTWNLDVNRNLGRGWALSTGYTGTRGSHLDMLRAPNRGPDGLRIEGVQPFTWQTSQGTSILHSTTLRLQRRQARGIGTRVSYTLAKSIDNASSLSGGGGVVAQDDTNLAAERSLSSFDRRHQLTANVSIDLPFGDGRRWLTQGGTWAALLGDWTVNASFSAQSGTPLTARVLAAVADVARGTNGTLRADATGAPVALDDPTLLRYFNTAAFALPAAGAFGTAGRNTIIGPGSAQLDASFSRNVSLGDRQSVALRLNVTNILNRVQYASVDTTVNSPSFGQVTSVRPMRAATLDLRFRF